MEDNWSKLLARLKFKEQFHLTHHPEDSLTRPGSPPLYNQRHLAPNLIPRPNQFCSVVLRGIATLFLP
jgi:hypothetical protein